MGQKSAKMFSWCLVPTADVNSTCVPLTSDETEELIRIGATRQRIGLMMMPNVTHIKSDDPRSLLQSQTLLTITICTLGFLGNGLVIWLLGFCIKRNPFTTYVLNLSIADLGFLSNQWLVYSPISLIEKEILAFLFKDMAQSLYCAGQYFLTVISVDRCVSVFFPLWYRCHRPKHLTTIICALIWVISFLPPGIGFMFYLGGKRRYHEVTDYQVIVNGFLCLPLMAISSLMLVNKVCSKLEQQKQRKLLIMILLNVLFFFIFSFPMNVAYTCYYLFNTIIDILEFFKVIGACLNSSINPIIYGLVVRPKKGGFMKNLKTMLQSLLSGEELSVEPREKMVEIPLQGPRNI